VALRIRRGVYATSAHVQAGTGAGKGRAARANRPRLGELGNSGNTSAPHLHFSINAAPTRWKPPACSATNRHMRRVSPAPLAVGADPRACVVRQRGRGWVLISTLAALAGLLAFAPPAGAVRGPVAAAPRLAWKPCASPA
jgi:murein DD-endopeptidase MepM/ murein hydrolase activator NlpD